MTKAIITSTFLFIVLFSISNNLSAVLCDYTDKHGRIIYVDDPNHPACKSQKIKNTKNRIYKLEEKKRLSINDKCNRGHFVTSDRRFIKDDPSFHYTIENNSSNAISEGTFEFTIFSEGRLVPWYEGTVTVSFPGGLEPNEKLTKEHGIFSTRINSEIIPESAQLNIKIHQLYSAAGQELCKNPLFSGQDERLLDELKNSLE